MIDGIWSLSMKRILVFTMRLPWQVLSCLIRKTRRLQWQQKGKPENDPMMGSFFKEFSESYNQANENWAELASKEVTKVASVAFKETLRNCS